MTSASPIPVIDMAPFYDGGKAEVSAVVDAVRRACEEIGFFLLRGHRVSPEVVARLAALSRAFFDYPQAEKSKVDDVGPLLGGLSYVPPKGENLAATLGAAVPISEKSSPWRSACREATSMTSSTAISPPSGF
jgi:isopenicillin N synthase-like dioxygenase